MLQLMARSKIPFLVSGTYALASYTGIDRPTKDVDVFAKAGDALKMLHYFKEHGFDVEIVDERWLNRVTRGDLFVDIITNMPTVTTHVTDEWFVKRPRAELFGAKVKLVPPTQFIWSKIFVQDHHRYDMADVAHMILKCHDAIDWKQLLSHMELYWEVLLMALLNFRFVYPSERNLVPKWLMDELLERLRDQSDVKGPRQKGLPRPDLLAARLCDRRRAMGLLRSGRQSRRAIWRVKNGKLRVAAIGDLHVQEDERRALSRAVRRNLEPGRRAAAVRRPDQLRQGEGGRDPRRRHQVLLDPGPRRAWQSRL